MEQYKRARVLVVAFLAQEEPYGCRTALTKPVSYTHTGYEGGFRGWGQSDTSWVFPMYEVSKNVFGKAVLSLVAEFQK